MPLKFRLPPTSAKIVTADVEGEGKAAFPLLKRLGN